MKEEPEKIITQPLLNELEKPVRDIEQHFGIVSKDLHECFLKLVFMVN